MSDRFVTARELAEELEISAGALLRWTRAGKVPAVKLPSGAIRYERAAIDGWLEANSMAGDATEGVSPAPNVTRRVGVSSTGSPAPLRTSAAATEEEPDAS